MSIILKSGDSNDLARIDGEGRLATNLPDEAVDAGFVKLAVGEGTELAATHGGHLLVTGDSAILFDQVDGNAINTNLWGTFASTMTAAQASGFVELNSGGSVAANAYIGLRSHKYVAMYGKLSVVVDLGLKVNILPQANVTMEVGLAAVAANAAPTDGMYFRWAPDGTFKAVINFGGSETSSEALNPPSVNDVHEFNITIDNDKVTFQLDGVQVAELQTPAGQPFPSSGTRLPLVLRVYNGASSPSTAPRIWLGRTAVFQQALEIQRPWAETASVLGGRGAYQSPITTFVQTPNHANSTSPASATLSNTAAGYATLGGRFQFAVPAGAATDFALFAYLVPLGYQLVVTGVSISAVNTGAAVATTATILDWSIGVNASAVSLATADGAGTWAPRRVPIGMQGFVVGADIGQTAADISRSFTPPLVVDGGRYLHVIVQVPVGTATGSQIVRGDVMITGYFD